MAGKPSAASVRWAAAGRLDALDGPVVRRLLDRSASTRTDIAGDVADIIARVRTGGDAALTRMAADFNGVALDRIEVPREALVRALQSLDANVRGALEQAAHAIAGFHRAQLPNRVEYEPYPGVRLIRGAEPLDSIGVYAPGGRAAYPSSVLMGAVPARVAGVREIVVCSPPGPNGQPAPIVLAACMIAKVDRVFALGGAGAIAALAHGTEMVPRVARVVGPGNAWVTEAKRQLHGTIAIDCPAGPSEILIIADETADPALIAAELAAQAEHDPDAAALLLASDATFAAHVDREIADLIRTQPREAIIRRALESRGALLVAPLEDACMFASRYAPEHLLIATARPRDLLPAIRNAGTIFVGESSSVAFGDYMTGANHVLPTGRAAVAFSGLDVLDFMRWMTVQEVAPAAAASLSAATAALADAEGLPGHAHAARLRGDGAAAAERTGVASAERSAGGIESDAPGAAGHVSGHARWVRRRAPEARVAYAHVSTYDPGRQSVAVDLSDNTNLFGVCPAVAAALSDVAAATTTRYPSVYADSLVEAAAGRFGVGRPNVTTGCGSDDVIDSAVRAFCEPGDALAYPWPTFGIVPTFARMNAVRPLAIEHRPGEALDRAALLETRARLIYICRPNNPTGTSPSRADILALADEFDGVLLVDEAYADFAEDDLLSEAVSSRNVVVLRTLSKAYGLAGMRIGLAVGPEPLIDGITKSRGPYKVGGAAERAAVAALRDGADWVEWCVEETKRNRDHLIDALRVVGLAPLDSTANFVLLPLPPGSGTAREVTARLRDRGIGVRPFEALPGAGDCIRVTVGPWNMMEAFLEGLTAVLPTRTGGE